MGRLERRRREEDAVIRDDAHGKTVDVCEPLPESARGRKRLAYTRGKKGGKVAQLLAKGCTNRHYGLPVFLLELAEPAPVHHTCDDFPHVKRLTKVRADDPMQLGRRIEWILRKRRRLGGFDVSILRANEVPEVAG